MIQIDDPSERQLLLVRVQLETAKTMLLELMAAADPKQCARYDAVLSLLVVASKKLNAMALTGDAEGPPH